MRYNREVDIADHPIWKQTTPYQTKINSYKKPLHLLRIYLARQYAKLYPASTFIAVTGSVGKTSCTQALLSVLSQKYPTISTKPNLDPILNVPSTIFSLKPNIKKAVFELGVEYPGEMDFYLTFFKPKVAIVTNIGFAHSQYLGGINEITDEKGKLLEHLPKNGIAILNWDDVNCRKIAERSGGDVVYFGTDPNNCWLWASNVKVRNFKTVFELNLGVERVEINYPLLGRHQIYPALAAATLGALENISLTKIKLALEDVQPAEHRLQPVTGPRGSIILDDSYNASPLAMEAAIDTLLQIPARRRIVALGEMRELGEYSESLHRQVAQKLYKEKIDLVFLGQGEASFIADELKSLGFLEERMEINLSNSQMVAKLLKTLEKGDVCLIKGSRAIRLDEVVKRVERKK